MAGEKFKVFNNLITKTFDGTIPMNSLQARSYKMALFTGGGNANDLTIATFGALTGELAAQNGYTAGGVSVTGLTVTSPAAGQFLIRGVDSQLQAVGGNLVFRYVVIYDTATGICCFTSPALITSGAAADLTVTANNYYIAKLSDGFLSYAANNA